MKSLLVLAILMIHVVASALVQKGTNLKKKEKIQSLISYLIISLFFRDFRLY